MEKDYWVTRSLKRLHESPYADSVVFKGGTALSKAHGIIERFSEDIDLACRPDGNQSAASRKSLMKRIESAVTQDFEYQQGHPHESKHGRFRKTAHAFPTLTDAIELGQVSNVIVIEINTFTDPEPSAMMPIATIIHDFLSHIDRADLISEYLLEPFNISVLGIERTLCEKVMGLVRASHEQDPLAAFRNRIRHIYDIAMIMRNRAYCDFVASQGFLDLIEEVRQSDQIAIPEAAIWTDPPLSEAMVFSDTGKVWEKVSSEFQGSFKEMVFGDSIPTNDEVLACLGRIGDSLQLER